MKGKTYFILLIAYAVTKSETIKEKDKNSFSNYIKVEKVLENEFTTHQQKLTSLCDVKALRNFYKKCLSKNL